MKVGTASCTEPLNHSSLLSCARRRIPRLLVSSTAQSIRFECEYWHDRKPNENVSLNLQSIWNFFTCLHYQDFTLRLTDNPSRSRNFRILWLRLRDKLIHNVVLHLLRLEGARPSSLDLPIFPPGYGLFTVATKSCINPSWLATHVILAIDLLSLDSSMSCTIWCIFHLSRVLGQLKYKLLTQQRKSGILREFEGCMPNAGIINLGMPTPIESQTGIGIRKLHDFVEDFAFLLNQG